ncbi:MAG TPA: thioredoxin domain-containing protein [Sphingomonas sp.]|nr:thioredoxin domain-containing protein [Sphingomonas sp.]
MTTLRFASLALPLLLLAACGGSGDANSSAPAASVTAVPPPAGKQWTDVVVKTDEGGYRMGNPDAPIKLVEYGSRLCPTCGNFGRTGQEPLTDNYVKTGKVSYEFREFLVHGAPDIPGALLGRCAGPGPFFPLLEAMFQNQDEMEKKLADTKATAALQQSLAGAPPARIATAWAEYLGYIDFVKQRGIPEAEARACLNDTKALDAITKVMQDAAQNKNVTGTPTFFLNGEQLQNVFTWEGVEARLKAAGA